MHVPYALFPHTVSLEASNRGKQERLIQNDHTGGPSACPHVAPPPHPKGTVAAVKLSISSIRIL